MNLKVIDTNKASHRGTRSKYELCEISPVIHQIWNTLLFCDRNKQRLEGIVLIARELCTSRSNRSQFSRPFDKRNIEFKNPIYLICTSLICENDNFHQNVNKEMLAQKFESPIRFMLIFCIPFHLSLCHSQ